MKMITKTCPHCGAPITGDHCEYCGAVFYDFSAIDITNKKPTYLKLKLPHGKIVMARALVDRFDFETTSEPMAVYADNTVFACVPSVESTFSLDFRLVADEDGILYKVVEETE